MQRQNQADGPPHREDCRLIRRQGTDSNGQCMGQDVTKRNVPPGSTALTERVAERLQKAQIN
eukprot:37504-Chlamydomonas_euryale.AAC.11